MCEPIEGLMSVTVVVMAAGEVVIVVVGLPVPEDGTDTAHTGAA
jgi:hypothetical protein